MNTKPKLIRIGPAFLLPLLVWAPALRAQDQPAPSDETVELPQFTVSGARANQYLETTATSVNRIAGSILDSPFTVDSVTLELMNDLGADSAFDATRYFAGVSPGRGTGDGGLQDRQDFRGFENFSKTIDDFSSFLLPTGSGFQATFDPAFVNRIDLVMGPDSVLSPTGAPGGSMNMTTKSPEFTSGTDVSAEVGNYNAQKFVVDTTGALGSSQHWAYRVIGSAQDTPTYVPGDLRQYNASVQLEYAFSPTAKIVFKYFGEQWGEYGTAAAANENGEAVYTPDTVGGATLSNTPQPGFTYDGASGTADWSERIDRVNIGEMEFTSALGEHASMRFGAQILYDNQTQDAAFRSSSPSETFNQSTGQAASVSSLNPAALATVAQFYRAMNRDIQLQNDYAANWKAGPVSLQPVVGWASQVGRSWSYILVDNNLPAANLATNFYNPAPPPLQNYTFSSYLPETSSLFQTYGVLRAGFFDDHLFLSGGVSRMWATVNDYSLKGVTVPGVGQFGAVPGSAGFVQDYTLGSTGISYAPSQSNYYDTYNAGIVVKLVKNVSIYGSSSTNAGIAASNPLWQQGKQYEFGVKADFFDQRLQLSAAHFQIAQNNVATQNPLYNSGQSTVPFLLLDETNHGEEFSMIGGLTSNLSIIANVTEMKLRDALGRRVRNVPDSMANLLLHYRFGDGAWRNLGVFAGYSYEGSVAGETVSGVTSLGVPEQPGFYLAPWHVINAGASYTLGRYRFNLNVDNVLNAQFWWQAAGRISVNPYPGATVRFTTSVHF